MKTAAGTQTFTFSNKSWRSLTPLLSALAVLLGLSFANAASQTWTNAPADATWTNINNWVARAVPGDINVATANTVNGDIATFVNPLVGGIGGAGNPIIPDDATVANGRSRRVSGLNFDSNSCGAYVIFSPSAPVIQNAGSPATGILYVSHNGAIRMNAAVTNSQTVLIPMQVNLPSSTAGVFNLVNNSTSPSAVLTINSITHAGATTRATTYILDGVNTGNNIVTNLSEGPGNGTGGFTKQGTGTWIIAGTGTFPAASPLNINNGTLAVEVLDAFGVATTASVASNALLRIDGVTLAQASLALKGNGTIRMNGTATLNGIAVAATVGMNPTVATTSAGDVFTIGNAILKVTGGAGDTVLHQTGPGTVLLGFTNNYAGRWSIDSGTNRITDPGALGIGANVNINAGAVLDVSPLGATTYTLTPAGLSGNGAGTVGASASTIIADPGAIINVNGKAIALTYSPTNFTGDIGRPALFVSSGTLSAGNNAFVVNNTSGTPLGIGTYRLIQQASGSVVDGGGYVVSVTGSGTAFGTLGAIQVSGANINLVVSAYTAKDLVWQGGHPNSVWDNGTTANWLNGVTLSVFTTSDRLVINDVGATNPIITLTGTLIPGSVTVQANATNYTFVGTGSIAGPTSLAKIGTNILQINTVNIYSGGTVISNGIVKIGVNNALPNTGSGTITLNSPGVLDLNTFSNSVGAVSGNGLIDNRGGGQSTLTLGANDSSGSFSGLIQNTSGSLVLAKNGLGAQTISGPNTFSGGTFVNAGTLRVGNFTALSASNSLTMNGGILDIQSDLSVFTMVGTSGTIENDSTATVNTLVLQGNTAAQTFGGTIANGSGGGAVAVKIITGTLTLSNLNTYTGGTIVGSGASFAIANAPASVAGFIIASNSATLSLSGGSGTPGTPTNIIVVDGATVTYTSGAEGKIWAASFTGSATTTNLINTTMSFGGASSFQNFLGLVHLNTPSGNIRFLQDGAAPTLSGGDNTTFEFDLGNVHTRGLQSVSLGSIRGGSGAAGIGGPAGAQAPTWLLGAKGLNDFFNGYISGSNNIVKVGTGRLTLQGVTNFFSLTVNDDGTTTTNYFAGNALTYLGSTTVSNGTLAIVAPANLNAANFTTFTLMGTNAFLDLSSAGFTPDGTNFVTNSVLALGVYVNPVPFQSFGGVGTLIGSLVVSNGTTLSVGLPLGALNVTTNVYLGGHVNMAVNASATPNSSELVSPAFSVDTTAALVVTNGGPENAATFQLFNHPVSFTSVTLPTLSGTNSWLNNLTVNGSITLIAPALVTVNTNPAPIVFSNSAGVLSMSWPSDHIGWRLQAQTNAATVGISTNWADVAGSTTTNAVTAVISTNATVFYRLIFP